MGDWHDIDISDISASFINAGQPEKIICEHIYGCQDTTEFTNIIMEPRDDNYHDGIGYEWFVYCPRCGKRLIDEK